MTLIISVIFSHKKAFCPVVCVISFLGTTKKGILKVREIRYKSDSTPLQPESSKSAMYYVHLLLENAFFVLFLIQEYSLCKLKGLEKVSLLFISLVLSLPRRPQKKKNMYFSLYFLDTGNSSVISCAFS